MMVWVSLFVEVMFSMMLRKFGLVVFLREVLLRVCYWCRCRARVFF